MLDRLPSEILIVTLEFIPDIWKNTRYLQRIMLVCKAIYNKLRSSFVEKHKSKHLQYVGSLANHSEYSFKNSTMQLKKWTNKRGFAWYYDHGYTYDLGTCKIMKVEKPKVPVFYVKARPCLEKIQEIVQWEKVLTDKLKLKEYQPLFVKLDGLNVLNIAVDTRKSEMLHTSFQCGAYFSVAVRVRVYQSKICSKIEFYGYFYGPIGEIFGNHLFFQCNKQRIKYIKYCKICL
jgi:hypothetical protein